MSLEPKDPSDYAVTRDFTEWLHNQRDKLERLAASKHPDGKTGAGQEPPFDPVAALRLATELRRRAEKFEHHWLAQAQDRLRAARAQAKEQLSSMTIAIRNANGDSEEESC